MPRRLKTAIIDYGMGNLFSVKQACERAGMEAAITDDPAVLSRCAALILPGVGAFGDAMAALERSGLARFLKEWAMAGKSLVGICLGMQLLMNTSSEFGNHAGLGIIPGKVLRFSSEKKVPQVGWNRLLLAGPGGEPFGLKNGSALYFVHSYYVVPEEENVVLATTRYGSTEFCSALCRGNIAAFQFHPERSGPAGLEIYRALAGWIEQTVIAREPGGRPKQSLFGIIRGGEKTHE